MECCLRMWTLEARKPKDRLFYGYLPGECVCQLVVGTWKIDSSYVMSIAVQYGNFRHSSSKYLTFLLFLSD